MKMLVTISELLLQHKKLLIIESLLLLIIPLLWSFGDKIFDSQSKTEISTVLLVQLLGTLSIIVLVLVFACLSLAGKIKELKNNIEHRRNLLARWRKMVHDVATQYDKKQESLSISALLVY